jgi:hypothetical protein
MVTNVSWEEEMAGISEKEVGRCCTATPQMRQPVATSIPNRETRAADGKRHSIRPHRAGAAGGRILHP